MEKIKILEKMILIQKWIGIRKEHLKGLRDDLKAEKKKSLTHSFLFETEMDYFSKMLKHNTKINILEKRFHELKHEL